LQAHREFVEVLGDLMVVVQAFIKIDLFIAVEIVQDGELIAAGHVDLAGDDLQP
jgi:hypothetical protein